MGIKKIVLAVAILLLPSMAFATGVTYSTSGSLTGAGFITFKDSHKHIPASNIPALNQELGTLKVNCEDPTCNTLPGATLTVTITQTLPGDGMGSTTATLHGSFTHTSGGLLVLLWSGPVSITAGGVTTVYNPGTSSGAVCTSGSCLVHLTADIVQTSEVPEPSTGLLLGLGTLGLMGLATVSRKLISP